MEKHGAKFAFVGSRKYPPTSYHYISQEINALPIESTVISGGAGGVDSVSVAFAQGRGLKTQVFNAEWDKHGVRAGFMRNPEIINPADSVFAFWDGISNGTVDSIKIAMAASKPLKIVFPDGAKFSPLAEYTYRPEKGKNGFFSGNVFYAHGNILDSRASLIINPCNTVGIAGAGLSKAIMDRYPQLLEPYREACFSELLSVGKPYFQKRLGNKPKTGQLPPPTSIKSGDSPHILHFPTKKDWRNPSQLSFIEQGLAHFVERFDEYAPHVSIIAFPRLGSGLGGLDWLKVRSLMEQHLSKLPVKVIIYHNKDE